MLQVLGIGEVRKHDAPASLLAPEVLHGGADRPLEDVVGEHHEHRVVGDETLRNAERLRNPTFLFLVAVEEPVEDRKSTRLNSSHRCISYAVFCLKKKKNRK